MMVNRAVQPEPFEKTDDDGVMWRRYVCLPPLETPGEVDDGCAIAVPGLSVSIYLDEITSSFEFDSYGTRLHVRTRFPAIYDEILRLTWSIGAEPCATTDPKVAVWPSDWDLPFSWNMHQRVVLLKHGAECGQFDRIVPLPVSNHLCCDGVATGQCRFYPAVETEAVPVALTNYQWVADKDDEVSPRPEEPVQV